MGEFRVRTSRGIFFCNNGIFLRNRSIRLYGTRIANNGVAKRCILRHYRARRCCIGNSLAAARSYNTVACILLFATTGLLRFARNDVAGRRLFDRRRRFIARRRFFFDRIGRFYSGNVLFECGDFVSVIQAFDILADRIKFSVCRSFRNPFRNRLFRFGVFPFAAFGKGIVKIVEALGKCGFIGIALHYHAYGQERRVTVARLKDIQVFEFIDFVLDIEGGKNTIMSCLPAAQTTPRSGAHTGLPSPSTSPS